MRADRPSTEVVVPEGLDIADLEQWKRSRATVEVLSAMNEMAEGARVGSEGALRRADFHQAVLQGGYHDGVMDAVEIVDVWLEELRSRAAGGKDEVREQEDAANDSGWD